MAGQNYMTAAELFDKLKNGLIVSCSCIGSEPFDDAGMQARFALAAVQGGAVGIRAEGAELVSAVLQGTGVPVIGWAASKFEDNRLKVTGSFAEIEKLLQAGSAAIAVDGSFRRREGITGPQYVESVKRQFDCPVLADVSTFAEGMACADYGADALSTFLSGLTVDTGFYSEDRPDFNIVQTLVRELTIPVIAHGKIDVPKFAKDLLLDGAWAVVIDTVVTKPKIVTGRFADALRKAQQERTEGL
jgi:N-acylglucosamine-6-phosphate 2-epimerase